MHEAGTIVARPSAYLGARGFIPDQSRRATACIGTRRFWRHPDGRSAEVVFSLLSATGQSSRGGAARWGFRVFVLPAAA